MLILMLSVNITTVTYAYGVEIFQYDVDFSKWRPFQAQKGRWLYFDSHLVVFAVSVYIFVSNMSATVNGALSYIDLGPE